MEKWLGGMNHNAARHTYASRASHAKKRSPSSTLLNQQNNKGTTERRGNLQPNAWDTRYSDIDGSGSGTGTSRRTYPKAFFEQTHLILEAVPFDRNGRQFLLVLCQRHLHHVHLLNQNKVPITEGVGYHVTRHASCSWCTNDARTSLSLIAIRYCTEHANQ